ncbi:hypothetical protein CEUSTIGMA_g379.t1 [Chlamydomonas eustigma]|uniref:Uncharacterized protein n=1 Tax=Chlamydomonas eustigma TaxID=1157962 RepID=A0A250WPZ5_9CHLO|nr:hypothetical protein CEUSTIGMA_g379.t1 [Chlamydomonas eustigma]|eukprot:GAX72924.1 hypothetical protein CEUSTIGMA_g379.t1 [Chlamydomonas eustigma]
MNYSRLKSLFFRASATLQAWLEANTAARQLFDNAGNVLQRLPDISNGHNFKSFLNGQELQHLVAAEQAGSAHAVIMRLNKNLERMTEVVNQQERLCVESWDALGSATSTAHAGAMLGACVSPAQMIEAMEDVWNMCRSELCLKLALAYELTNSLSFSVYEESQGLFHSSIHVDETSASYLLLKRSTQRCPS